MALSSEARRWGRRELVELIYGHESRVERVARGKHRGRIGMHRDVEGRYELGVVPGAAFFVVISVCLGVGIEIDNHYCCSESYEYLFEKHCFEFVFSEYVWPW